jgi:hypothetical protein
MNLASCFHVSGPYRYLFYEFQEYPPRLSCLPVPCPPVLDQILRLVLSSFLVVEKKLEKRKKKEKKETKLADPL